MSQTIPVRKRRRVAVSSQRLISSVRLVATVLRRTKLSDRRIRWCGQLAYNRILSTLVLLGTEGEHPCSDRAEEAARELNFLVCKAREHDHAPGVAALFDALADELELALADDASDGAPGTGALIATV